MKNEKQNSIREVADDLNFLFSTNEPQKENKECFRLTEEDKKEILSGECVVINKTSKISNFFSFVKKNVRPDVGVNSFRDGECPDLKNENLYEIGDKLRKNLKVGLKITIKF